jgi:AcrR family transcriptional regulator
MPAPSYHHGDLRNALQAAAVDLITERGPAGFSLREVARRAGVSHAAPAHHYGNTTGLLTVLAVEAFQHLHARMVASTAGIDDPAERLVEAGVAYVVTGREYPAHCAVVFRGDLVDTADPDYAEWGQRTYSFLEATVQAVADRYNPSLDIGDGSRLCWSAMQGLLVLHPHMAPVDLVGQARAFGRLILNGLLAP